MERNGSSPVIFLQMDDIVQVDLNLYTRRLDCVGRAGMFGGSFGGLGLSEVQVQVWVCEVATQMGKTRVSMMK